MNINNFQIDLKTIIIVVLLGVIAALYFIGDGGASGVLKDQLKELKKEHKQEMKNIEQENEALEKVIQDQKAIIQENDYRLKRKDELIDKLTVEKNLNEEEIKRLQDKLAQFDQQFDNMSDDELMEWVKNFLKNNE